MFKVVIVRGPIDINNLENALNDGFEIHHTAYCHKSYGFVVYTLKKEKTDAK